MQRRSTLSVAALAVVALLLVACASTATPPEGPGTAPQFDGPNDGALIGADALNALEFRVTGDPQHLASLQFALNGDVVEDAELAEGTLRFRPQALADGEHTVTVLRPGDSVSSVDTSGGANDETAEALHAWQFTVDTQPPSLALDRIGPRVGGAAIDLAGTTDPHNTIEVDGATATADGDGQFLVAVDTANDELAVTASNAAGNTATETVTVRSVPSRVSLEDGYRAVHVSFCAWATPSFRDPILDMIDDGLINAVQLDIKDEAGQVGFASNVALAQDSGATNAACRIDLAAAVELLHERGVPVIGRFVAFADPILAQWAWENDRRDWVVQTDDGEMYVGRYNGFTNFAHQDIIDYNIALAVEAASHGVDHILWDYIRRPDGALENMHFVGLDGTPTEGIVAFVEQADAALAPYGVVHGASVYGIASTRPHEIAQDIPGMGDYLDYVAPMVYPTHWAPGEFGLANPERSPYDIVYGSLGTFLDVLEGKRARVIPWLEDSTYRAWDRPFQVAEQLRATRDLGINEWMLWDPRVRYTPEAIAEVRDEEPDERSSEDTEDDADDDAADDED